MTDQAPPNGQITVKPAAGQVVMSETTKALMLLGFAFILDRLLRSDAIKMAVVPMMGMLATFVWGLWHRLRTYFALRFLAGQVPDEVAKVGK